MLCCCTSVVWSEWAMAYQKLFREGFCYRWILLLRNSLDALIFSWKQTHYVHKHKHTHTCTPTETSSLATLWGYPFNLSIVKLLQGQFYPQKADNKGYHWVLLFKYSHKVALVHTHTHTGKHTHTHTHLPHSSYIVCGGGYPFVLSTVQLLALTKIQANYFPKGSS